MNEEIISGKGKTVDKDKTAVSTAVIRRLPRYYRYLRELIRNGQSRISSGELSRMMNVTASQIRQDLNCFGGFGQQGYGYNVNYLFAKISEILGVGENYSAIIVGAGNLGRALVRTRMFERRGVDVVAMFDIDPALVGKKVDDVMIYDMAMLKEFCSGKTINMAVLAVPKAAADEVVEQLSGAGVHGVWNFTGKEITAGKGMIFEDVYLGDSLMSLCYALRENDIKNAEKEAK